MMSDKKRKRGRPRVAPILSYGSEQKLRNNCSQRNIKKPKYLKDQDEEDSLSRSSTPARSIDSRGSLNGNKSKNFRGYNLSLDDKDSEYHYGSDFDIDDDDPEAEKNVLGIDSTHSRSVSDITSETGLSDLDDTIGEGLSEGPGDGADFVPFWQLGPAGTLGVRSSTPVPVWLQEREYPELVLPKSSDDLLLPRPYLFIAVGIYEILRHFKHLARLSPFYIEDFCAALISPEQSNLLIEVHIALIKALIREEDSQQTHFGILDQKDSINISLYFVDNLTWPETLRQYLYCDKSFRPILDILNSCNYPFTSLSNRLEVLKFLCDQFLQTSVVRDFLLRDGKIRYDDHCRACYKPGDLLCCDSCSAVYHLDCVNPPITSTPSEIEDWTCVVCNVEKLQGVTDCLSLMEASGMMCRQEPIGYDRHGRKYWFLARRIFVEREDGDTIYYSTARQLDLLMNLIDKDDLEESLHLALNEFLEDIKKQMIITEKLTDSAKGNKMDELTLEIEETELKIEQLEIKRDKPDVKDEIKEENKTSDTIEMDLKKEVDLKDESMEGICEDTKPEIKKEDIASRWTENPRKVWPEATLKAMIKTKLQQFHHNNSSSPFRLSCDNSYRSYVNYFSTNPLALNKLQHNEERDKKRQLSHKFSLSSGTEFKWSGSTHGSKESLIATVRQTLCSLEQNISSHFFHPHWHNIRKTWNLSVTSSTSPKQFASSMALLVACIKPLVFLPTWHDSLGHIRLKRITALDREERKKQEKREKKEADDEAKLFPFIKYSKIPRHQIWKTRGEEYRMHGLWGWQWLAYHRKTRSQSMYEVGLRSGPDKICLPIQSDGDSIKTLPTNVDSYKIIAAKNRNLQFSLLSPKQRKEEDLLKGLDKVPLQTDFVVSAASGVHQTLKVVNVNLEDHFENGIVPVSKALNNRARILYPKIGKQSSLNGLLAKRLTLKILEERNFANKKNTKCKSKSSTTINVDNDDSDSTETDISEDENIEELPDSQRISLDIQGPTANLLKEIRVYKAKYESLDEIDTFLPCYSQSCREEGRSMCYSPSCLLKEKIKKKLIMSLKNFKIVSGKHAPFDVIGSHNPIKVKDLEKSPKKKRKNSITKTKTSTTTTVNGQVVESEGQFNDDDIVDGAVSNASDSKLSGDEDCSRSSYCSDHKGDKVFSSQDTSGVIYLKKSSVEIKKTKKRTTIIPQLSSYKINSCDDDTELGPRQSFFVLPAYELRKMARSSGCKFVSVGYNPNAKTNPYTWPYPSARPVFKLTWLYRTMTMPTISAAAYQLRILWACMRWDDMHEKGLLDGRKQVTTDSEIVQTEILKRKYVGRFLEKTEYLRRKVTIPLDVPKAVREFTPSQRSGLRKRRRALSPVNKQPKSIEEWVEEDKLDLWEIRYFGEQMEKAAILSKKAADRESFTPVARSISPSDFKTKMEEQMKIQRASFHQKKSLEQTSGIIKVAINSSLSSKGGGKMILGGSNMVALGSKLPVSPMASNRKIVTTKSGKIITVQTSGGISSVNQSNSSPKFSLGKNSTVFPVSSLPKVQVTSQGKPIIKLQTVSPGSQRSILPRSTTTNSSGIRPITAGVTTLSSSPSSIRPQNANQPIQFVRLADGQIQMKSFPNAQQLLQRSDGKLQILSAKTGGSSQFAPTSQPIQITQQQLKTVTGVTTLKGLSSGGQIVKINGQQLLLQAPSSDLNKSATVNDAKIISSSQANLRAVKTPEGYTLKSICPGNASTLLKEKQISELTSPTKSDSQNTLTLRVQVRMTEQGPKTIIQGLQPGAGLTKDHILAIQQQVRNMLANRNLQINQLSPLMTITLNILKGQEKTQPSPNKISPSKFLTTDDPSEKKMVSPKGKPFVGSPLASPTNTSIAPPTTTDPNKEFVVTNDYIQQSIKSALNKKNELPPTVEEKLVQLQKFTNEKSKSDDFKEDLTQGTKRKLEKDENEWDPQTPSGKSKSKRSRVDRSKAKKDVSGTIAVSTSKAQAQDHKRKVLKQQKLDSMLSKLKDLLKKDILKKRASLEKELQIQIHKDLAIAKQQMQKIEKLKTSENVTSSSKKKHDTSSSSQSGAFKESRSNRKSESGSASVSSSIVKSTAKIVPSSGKKKGCKSKSKKIVCICRTPFDDTKFYVGCDLCGNWFHGECVGITEALSRSMTEYVCDDCTNAKINKDLYCFCRQPYDESQFYICCERCEDWFHGKCIGIMQAEADDIDDYICPKCDPNNKWNRPCQKKLNSKEYTELKKLAKSLVSHKSAWPFLEPVDQSEVPDYYKLVKEPMDLKTIDAKVSKQKYDTLSKFVADVMLVFDNCRAYNPPNSSFCSCAQALELFFCQRLKQFKLKLSQK